jgi:hypothetical protein
MSTAWTIAEQWRPIFDALSRLRVAWPARGWSWDSRILCVTSSFNNEYEDQARQAIAAALPLQWTAETLATATPRLRALVERTGGLRADQFVVSAGPYAGLIPFGLWWPWRDGDTISMRLGFVDVEPSSPASLRLREIFNVDA